MRLGQLLENYMRENKLSTRQLALEVGCDHCTIHRIIKGEAVRLDILLQLMVWLLNPNTK